MEISDIAALISHNPETGKMTWLERPYGSFSGPSPIGAARTWNKRYAGKPAFNSDNGRGYLTGCIFATRFSAHRLIWALHYGAWPEEQIDHINRDTTDNRICNLRLATPAQNAYNAIAKKSSLIESKARGAQFHTRKGKWTSSIRVHLGYFDSAEEASAAYEKAAKELHAGFYNPNGLRPGP